LFYHISFSNGCLGSQIDEECSEMRYLLWIVRSRDSSKFWMCIMPLGNAQECACLSVCRLMFFELLHLWCNCEVFKLCQIKAQFLHTQSFCWCLQRWEMKALYELSFMLAVLIHATLRSLCCPMGSFLYNLKSSNATCWI